MSDSFERPWHGIGTGGSTALDFANTLDWRLRPEPVELLRGYPDLLRFARSAGALTAAEAKALRRWAEAHPRAARTALTGAAEVREAIAAVFQALVDSKPIPAAPLTRLESACREASTARALRARQGSAEWVWRASRPEPERPVWAAALEAARILTSPEASARVRQCADDACGWFFLDTSRNRTRRWCSMKGCGNRNKVRRFYERSAARKKR